MCDHQTNTNTCLSQPNPRNNTGTPEGVKSLKEKQHILRNRTLQGTVVQASDVAYGPLVLLDCRSKKPYNILFYNNIHKSAMKKTSILSRTQFKMSLCWKCTFFFQIQFCHSSLFVLHNYKLNIYNYGFTSYFIFLCGTLPKQLTTKMYV